MIHNYYTMKTKLPFILLAASALTFVSCTGVPNTTRLSPLQDVERVERQSQVTPNSDYAEALNARNAMRYSLSTRF